MSGTVVLAMALCGCDTETPLEQPISVKFDMELQGQRMERRLESLGIEKPENWEEMNMGERMEFLQMHGGMGGDQMGQGGNPEFMKERFVEAGVEMPQNWDEMTREERRVFMEENGMETMRPWNEESREL